MWIYQNDQWTITQKEKSYKNKNNSKKLEIKENKLLNGFAYN